jgi:hypothetical protein
MGKAGNYIKQGQFKLGTHLKRIMEIANSLEE